MRAAGDMLSPCGYCFVSCDGGYLSVKVGEGWVSRVGLSSGVSGVDEGSDFAGEAGSEMFSKTLGDGGLCGFGDNFVEDVGGNGSVERFGGVGEKVVCLVSEKRPVGQSEVSVVFTLSGRGVVCVERHGDGEVVGV